MRRRARHPRGGVSTGSSGKRKRADPPVQDLIDSSDAESEDDPSDDESNLDEEEIKERRKKASKEGPSKSVAKKQGTGPALTTNLAVRPAVNGAKPAVKL